MKKQDEDSSTPVLVILFFLVLFGGMFIISFVPPKRNGVTTSDEATPQPVTVFVVVQTAPAGRQTSITLTFPAACEVEGAASATK